MNLIRLLRTPSSLALSNSRDGNPWGNGAGYSAWSVKHTLKHQGEPAHFLAHLALMSRGMEVFFFPNSNILKLQLEFPEQIWLPVPTTQQIPVILNCSSSRERPKNPNQSQPTRILGWEICQINLFHWGWRAPKQREKCTLKAKLGQGY